MELKDLQPAEVRSPVLVAVRATALKAARLRWLVVFLSSPASPTSIVLSTCR